jgi:hypothetical protein
VKTGIQFAPFFKGGSGVLRIKSHRQFVIHNS